MVVAAIIIFFRPDFSFFLPLVINLFFRSLYFVAILIFLWRFFPAKDLLQSSLLSIFGLEVLGLLVSIFLLPDIEYLWIVFSPILSSLHLALYISNPAAMDIIFFSLGVNIFMAVIFYLASIVLIKSEIRFD